MFDKIAVVGTGVIGTLAGGFLTLGGYDVTVVPIYRKESVEKLREKGIRIEYEGEVFQTPVKAEFIDDIPADEIFDLVLITGKSNDTERMVGAMLPHLAADGVLSSLQNSINEDLILTMMNPERVVPCVCYTGGFSPEAGVVENHPGFLLVGELDGSDTPRVRELAKVLSAIKPTDVTSEVMLKRWGKLSEISMGVPLCCVSGYPQFCGNDDPRMQRLFARLACETFNTARACGYDLEQIGFMREEEMKILAVRDDAVLGDRMAHHPMAKDAPEEGATGLAALVDAYTKDIRAGRPLEVYFANGYITQKAAEHGVPTPTHNAVLAMIREVELGTRKAEKKNLEELIAQTDAFYL